MPQKPSQVSQLSSHLPYPSFPLHATAPVLNRTWSSSKAGSRFQRLKGGQEGWLLQPPGYCHPAPPPSQPIVNCSSDLTFAFSTGILIIPSSKTTLSAFELQRNPMIVRNHFHIWKMYSLLSRMDEIQVKCSPCNLTWTSASQDGPYNIKLGKA